MKKKNPERKEKKKSEREKWKQEKIEEGLKVVKRERKLLD